MPIGTKNFAFAHARLISDGETVRVTKATGFTPAIAHPGEDHLLCGAPDDLPKVTKVKPADPRKLPKNTLLYRLSFPGNHQIDRAESVVTVSSGDRETHRRYRLNAWSVSDRTVEVALELRDPDVNDEGKDVFRLDVLVFRVD